MRPERSQRVAVNMFKGNFASKKSFAKRAIKASAATGPIGRGARPSYAA